MMSSQVLIVCLASALFVCVIAQGSVSDLPEVKGYKLHCIEASGITEAAAKKLADGESIPSPDQQTKCFIHCFFQKLRLINEKGVVNVDKLTAVVAKVMDEQKAKDIVKACEIKRTNPCDTAYAMYDCYLGKKAKLF